MCQKFSGSAFGAFMRVMSCDFQFVGGIESLEIFESSEWAARSFCKKCGSSIEYINNEHPEYKFIAAGTLDNSPGINAHQHIFTANKASWYGINKELPQFLDWESSRKNNIR
jgi:hypothetical protein